MTVINSKAWRKALLERSKIVYEELKPEKRRGGVGLVYLQMAVVYFARKSFKDVGLLFPIIAWCSPLSHSLALDQTTSAFFLELSLSRLSFLLLGSDLRGFQSVPSSYEYRSATVGALFRWCLYRALKPCW